MIQMALAGLQAASSIFGGLSARSAEKSTRRWNIHEARRAEAINRAEIKRGDKHNAKLSKRLAREIKNTKLVTTERNKTTGFVDVNRMMKDAEKAGFNPATWLASGALSAYSGQRSYTVNTSKGHNAVAAAQMEYQGGARTIWQTSAAPITHVRGAGEAVAAGVGQFAQGVSQELTRQDAMDFQATMMGIQLGAAARQAQGNKFGGIPTMIRSGSGHSTGILPGLSAGIPANMSAMSPNGPIAPGEREAVNPWPKGSKIYIDPTVPNADILAQRYGDSEIFSTLAGMIVGGADLAKNVDMHVGGGADARALRLQRNKAKLDGFYRWLMEPVTVKDFVGGLSK